MIIIKKYANRRLYDSRQSTYINLEGIRQLVIDHEAFKVLDAKTGEDLTTQILLQIILELESNQQSMLTDGLLRQLIRFYETPMQPLVRQYLEMSMQLYLQHQDNAHRLMRGLGRLNPLTLLNRLESQPPQNKSNPPPDTDP
jgi:polyhydroxyalkanoate synthesis repressor PhaR